MAASIKHFCVVKLEGVVVDRAVSECAVIAREGCVMYVRNNKNGTPKFESGLPFELINQDAVWSEFKYVRGSEIFGEAEPADFVYRVRGGAVRTHKLLSDGRRLIGAFHLPGDMFGAKNDEVHRFTAEAIVNTTHHRARGPINLLAKASFKASPQNPPAAREIPRQVEA
jgi:CRP-like cAMP-binding protein